MVFYWTNPTLGTVLAARFDQSGTYQQNHFPKRVNTRFPGSIKAASKFILIFPENIIKHNLSKKSSHQNERKFNLHQGNKGSHFIGVNSISFADLRPRSKQKMAKTKLRFKNQFGHPVKVIKGLWKDSRGVAFKGKIFKSLNAYYFPLFSPQES